MFIFIINIVSLQNKQKEKEMKKSKSFFIVLMVLVLMITMPCFAGGEKEDSDSKTVVYWSMWNEAEPQGLVLVQAAEAYEEETGVAVEIVFNGREIRKTLQPALDAGEVVDIFDEDVTRVNGIWADYLLPLDELASQVYPSTDGKSFENSVSSALLDLARQEGKGVLKVIPYQPYAFIVMYNKDLFNEAGISGTPKTWEEFEVVCEKLKAAGITPLTTDDAYMAVFFGYNIARLAGEERCLEMAMAQDFNDPSVQKFGEIWEDFAKKGYISKNAASNIYPAGQIEEIAKGTTAMYLNGTWLPNEIKGSAPDFNWGCFAWPEMDPNSPSGVETNNYGAQSFGINKNSTVAKEAFEFVVYMTTGKWDGILAQESLGVPMGLNSVWPKQTQEAKVVIDNTTNWMTWGGGMEADANITSKIKENFKKLITGALDAESFYAAMNK